MYTLKESEIALEAFDRIKSQRKTVLELGYPERSKLSEWIRKRDEGTLPENDHRCKQRVRTSHRHFKFDEKLTACKSCFLQGESVQSVAKNLGIAEVTLYTWRKQMVQEG